MFGILWIYALGRIYLKDFASDMLTPQDVAVDSHTTLFNIVIHVKRSKNDPFGVGAWLHLGATGQWLCPVAALLGYSSSATITGSSVSVPGWYNPIEIEVNRFPTPGASGGWSGLIVL